MFLNVIGRCVNSARSQMLNVNSTHCVRVNSLLQTNDVFQRPLSVGVNCWNHYKLLGVGHNATKKEIKAAFIEKCQIYHPDRNPGMHEKFVAIQEAYETLGSPNKRNDYDQTVGIRPVRNYERTYHNNNHYDRNYYSHNRKRNAPDEFNYQQFQEKYAYRSRAARTAHSDPLRQYWNFVYQSKQTNPNGTAASKYSENSDVVAIILFCGICMLYVISKVQSTREYDRRMLLRQTFADQQAAKELRAQERAIVMEKKRQAAQEMERLKQDCVSFVTEDQSYEAESKIPDQEQDYKPKNKIPDQEQDDKPKNKISDLEQTRKTETKVPNQEQAYKTEKEITDQDQAHKAGKETPCQEQIYYKTDMETSDQESSGTMVFKKTDPDMSLT